MLVEYLKLLTNRHVSYVSDELWMLFILLIASVFVLYPLVHFFKIPGAILGIAFLSSVFGFLFLYGVSLGRSFANSQGNLNEMSVFLPAFFTCVLIFGFLSFGYSLLSNFFSGKEFSRIYLIIWLLVVGLTPVVMFARDFIPQAYEIINNVSMDVTVTSHKLYPVHVDEMTFYSSKTSRQVRYGPIHGIGDKNRFYNVADFFNLSLNDQMSDGVNRISTKYEVTHQDAPTIPLGTDSFTLSWYSYSDQKYYSDTFPFPWDKLDTSEPYYDGRKMIRGITLHLIPGGNASLLSHKKHQVANFIKIEERSIDEQHETQLREKFIAEADYKGSSSDLLKALDGIRDSGILSTLQDYNRYFSWTVSHNLSDTSWSVGIVDFGQNEFRITQKSEVRSPLPRLLKITSEAYRFEIYLNGKTLFNKLNHELRDCDSDLEIVVEFDSDESKVEALKVLCDDNVINLDDFEVHRSVKT